MNKHYLFCLIIGIFTITSCSKFIENEGIESSLSIKSLKRADAIPPKLGKTVYINRFSDTCKNLSALTFDTLYKVSGNVSKAPSGSDSVFSFYLNNNQTAQALFKHNFVKGIKYSVKATVTLKGVKTNWDLLGVNNKVYFPKLSLTTLKSVSPSSSSNVCGYNILQNKTPQDQITSTVWNLNEIYENSVLNQEATITLNVTGDGCFNFIGLVAQSPNDSEKIGNEQFNIHIKSLSISESSDIRIEGKKEMYVNETQNISYSMSGFQLTEPVNWYVKGDLEIIGSSTGYTVTIKSIGAQGGTVGFNPCNSSQKGIEYDIVIPNIINGPDRFCQEGIYFIPPQENVYLEDPMNIATLTPIGSGQYKISKISNGKIKIVSAVGDNIVKKEIIVGARNDLGTFRISPRIMGIGTYYIYYEDPEEMINPVTNWSISSTSNNVQIFPDGPDKAVIHINSWNSNQLSANSITVTATGSTVCGDTFFREIAIAGGAEILDPDL